DVSGPVGGDPVLRLEAGGEGRTSVAPEDTASVTRDRPDDAPRGDTTDAAVPLVGDVELAAAVDSDGGHLPDLGLGRRSVVARETLYAGAHDSGDHAVRTDLADPEVGRVGDVQVARRVDRQAVGGHAGGRSGAAVAGGETAASAGD